MIKYSIKKYPILGVCRGMQVINFFLKVSKLELMVYELSIKFFKDKFFKKSLSVNSFHNFGIPAKKCQINLK